MLAIIVATAMARIVFGAMLGLGIDESYMVASGRALQLSYFDHPPVSWWLAWSASHLLGSEAPIVVRLPFIACFAASTWLMYRLTATLFTKSAGVWAVLAFNLAPVFSVSAGSWVLPDGPLDAALLGSVLCLIRALASDRRRAWAWWLGAGLCAGLALLSKYTAIMVLLGAVLAVVSHPIHRRWLLRPQPWGAAALAALLLSPVVLWNAEHHWSSVAFQGGRALGGKWHPLAPLLILGGESLFLLPWIWLAMMIALVAAWRGGRKNWPAWLLACSGTGPIVLFAAIGLWARGHVLFHWAAPGYLMLFPLLGAWLERWQRFPRPRLIIRRAALASALLIVAGVALAGSEVRWNWLPYLGENFASGKDPDLAAVDWTSVASEIRTRGWTGPHTPVLATLRWQDAGKLDYALGSAATVLCLGGDPREFGLIHPAAAHVGEDALVLVSGKDPTRTATKLRRLFESVEPERALTLLHGGRPAMHILVFLGRRLRGWSAT